MPAIPYPESGAQGLGDGVCGFSFCRSMKILMDLGEILFIFIQDVIQQ